LTYCHNVIAFIIGVHGFKGSGGQGFILVPGLHLGCVFTTKASASSGLIQDLEPNWQLSGEISIFNEDFKSLMSFLVLNPEPVNGYIEINQPYNSGGAK
jgi:hypothetical protein